MQRLGFLLRKFFYLQCNRLKPNANHNSASKPRQPKQLATEKI